MKAVGDEIFANREKVLDGSHKRKTKEIVKVLTTPRGLDFQGMGAAKVIGIEGRKIAPPYQEALNKYN